jgi:glutathione S-transferase
VEQASGQGLVPMLVDDDGTVVSDSPVILEYLESRHPSPPLYPRDAARRAEMETFVDWFDRVWKPWPNGIEAEPDSDRVPGMAAEMDRALDRFQSVAGRARLAEWIARVDAMPRA